MDGDARGRIKRTLANRTGITYKILRTEIEKCKNREDLKWSGVYFLQQFFRFDRGQLS